MEPYLLYFTGSAKDLAQYSHQDALQGGDAAGGATTNDGAVFANVGHDFKEDDVTLVDDVQ